MVTTTDTYVQVGTKWELQNHYVYADVDGHRSPATLGTDYTFNGRTYPRKSNYFWQVNFELYNSRRDGYGSGDANFLIKLIGQQNNTGDSGGMNSDYSWRILEMNTSDHGDDADKEIQGIRVGSTSTANIQSFCYGANGENWEQSNGGSKVHDALFILHIMRSGSDDGAAYAPDIFKVMGNTATNYGVGNGLGFINNQNGQISNGTSHSIIMSPPSVPIYDYPDTPNGTLFEESDTGKIYMFDGTDTWNETT